MSTMRTIVLLVGLIGCCLAQSHSRGTNGVRSTCTSNKDCSPGECCLLSPNRFSIATCSARGGVGESCRPGATKLKDTTLTYPNGSKITLLDYYFAVCPCAGNLKCGERDGVCHRIAKKYY